MKTRWFQSLTIVLLLSSATSAVHVEAQSSDEFQKRRQTIRDLMDPDSILVLRSAVVVPETAYRQESTLHFDGLARST